MKKRNAALIVLLVMAFMFCSSFSVDYSYYVKRNGTNVYSASTSRDKACDRMNSMAEVPWSLSKSVTYNYKGSTNVTLTAGKYRGIPYTQKQRYNSVPDNIGTYISSTPIRGLDCSSAVSCALRYGTENNGSSSLFLMQASGNPYSVTSFAYDAMRSGTGTGAKLDGSGNATYGNYVTKLGYYGSYSPGNTINTETIIKGIINNANYSSGTIFDNVYAKMRPGDMLIRLCFNSDGSVAGHIELVTGVSLSYKGNMVDPNNSYVYFTDEIKPNRTTYVTGSGYNGEKTSWRNSHTKEKGEYKFSSLTTSGYYYLPARLNQWAGSTYTVKYDANGGTGAPASQTKNEYTPLKLSTTKPTRSGYTFNGWKPASSAYSGNLYSAGGYYLEERSETLVAQWVAKPYVITYDANGGTGGPGTQSVKVGATVTIPSTIPTRAGYYFRGWVTSSGASVSPRQPGDSYTPSGDRTFYAAWVRIKRLYGDTRYVTGMKVADQLASTKGISQFGTVIVASGKNFPDALAGGYLAKVKDAPILLVDSSSQYDVASYISSKLKSGGKVYVLGGTSAVPANFESLLNGSFTVKRLAGNTRYETCLKILNEAGVSSQDILVCTGTNYPDSLSASAAGLPILLVGDNLSAVQRGFLSSLSSNQFYIIGGEGAVNSSIESELSRYGSTERISGSSRYNTSKKIAIKFFGSSSNIAVLAYGNNFPDGLSGGPLAQALGAPLILVSDSNYSDAKSYLHVHPLKEIYILGGSSIISSSTAVNVIR